MRVIVLQHFPALNRMPDTLDKEKIGDSKKREQREEQSQSRYLHTEARGALKGRVEPSRASKGPFYACGRKGSVKLSYRAVYFFISRLDPIARARARPIFLDAERVVFAADGFPDSGFMACQHALIRACERAANKKNSTRDRHAKSKRSRAILGNRRERGNAE